MSDSEIQVEGPPERGTAVLSEYFWTASCDSRLFHFVVDTVLTGDFVAHRARAALAGEDVDPELTPADLAASNPGPRTDFIRRSRQELLEMFVARVVDNFQVYLVDFIRAVLRKRPEILSARKQELTLGYVLDFDSIEELVADIVEARVNSLSYEGFGKLQNWCDAKGIPLIVPDGERARVVELIALRNLIVHNRGRIDERFLRGAPNLDGSLGAKRRLNVDDLFEAMHLLNRIVRFTDTAGVGKFGLEEINVREDLAHRHDDRYESVRRDEGGDLDEAPDDPSSPAIG